jgi:hypothetical protein
MISPATPGSNQVSDNGKKAADRQHGKGILSIELTSGSSILPMVSLASLVTLPPMS